MNTTRPVALPANLAVAELLAQLLQRLERSAVPVGAEQYRSVVSHLHDELADLPAGEGLNALLDAYPAAAQVYENLRYAQAGLCRSPLELSLHTEVQARQAIARAMRTAARPPTGG